MAKLPPTFFTRLGVPWIWGADVERAWIFMQVNVVLITVAYMTPGSRAYGIERVPASGGGVLAANHLSAIDPPLLGSFSRRALWYMSKAELLEMPFIGEALSWTGAFPIRRGASDREGLRMGRELVREGHIVGVFVEGTRQRFGYPADEIHPGAAAIAVREGVPVIPCGIESFRWSRRNRRACCVVFGEPITLDGIPASGRGYKQASEIIRREIVRLWRQAAEAVARGLPSELPDGTRRGRIPWLVGLRPVRSNPRRPSGLL